MKNLSRRKGLESKDQESPEELATQGYQRRFFNSSPLVVELASAFDQALAELEQGLTQEMRERDGQPPKETDDGFQHTLPAGTERTEEESL